ncbi:uncharacterized protein LOC113457878 [Microtus ochrogaster]|uniref:Uncharacterized protein LOC113457878 n=1 Tax=Microtus ochrogaster TaxID=79684 RepID=A0ABM1UME3_MICOH|nr:uncharacterized protein LOC113457878 [Microtus ochrogaster]
MVMSSISALLRLRQVDRHELEVSLVCTVSNQSELPNKGYSGSETGQGEPGCAVTKAARSESDRVLRQRPTGPTSDPAPGTGPAATQSRPGDGVCGCAAAPPHRGSRQRQAPLPAQPARAPWVRPPETLPHSEPKESSGLREPSAVPQPLQPFLNAGGEIPACPSPDAAECDAFWDLGADLELRQSWTKEHAMTGLLSHGYCMSCP